MDKNRLVDANSNNDDDLETFVQSIRPKNFSDVVGRVAEKKNLRVVIDAAKQRGDAVDHILLHGPPGLGKTSLANVISNEVGTELYSTSGAAIDKKGDLASILTNIEENGILFIDEIHRLHKSIEEMLYSAMEDRQIDIIIGKGPSARTLKLELNPFTIIGATTKVALLSSPLRDRFGMDLRLDYYSYPEMQELIEQKAELLKVGIDADAAKELARRSRRTPRIAVRILKRLRDLAQVQNETIITHDLALEGLKMINVDRNGLDYLDKKILNTIITNFDGGPVGINTLAAALTEDINTIQDVYEPFLLKEGFIIRTPRGRVVTEKALKYFKD